MSENYPEIVKNIIAYVNSKDFFWLYELRSDLQLSDVQISGTIRKLRDKRHIQCSEKKGKSRQYVVLQKVILEEFLYREPKAEYVVTKRRTAEQKKEMSERKKEWWKEFKLKQK